VLDAEIHLNANGVGDTIKEGNKTSVQDKAKILMKNHETCPTGTAPFPEANVATFNNQNGGRGRGRGRGSNRGRGRGFGRGIYHGVQFNNTSGHNKWQDKGKMNEKGQKARSVTTNTCYRCESVNHWACAL
ncbi:hypothetical protein Tco_1305995, partial [Tanacetum coccineum]